MSCPHGYPTRMACSECMMEGAVAPARPDDTQMLRAERIVIANYAGHCARKRCEIEAGDSIGYVTDVGWCCSSCAR